VSVFEKTDTSPRISNSICITVGCFLKMSKFDIKLINLKHRVDRWTRILTAFTKNQYFNIDVVPAVYHKTGYIGCTLSHAKILRSAIEHGDDYVIVMEDDAVLNEKFLLKDINKIVETLVDNLDKWEIFNGAPTFWSVRDNLNDVVKHKSPLGGRFATLNWGQTTHFMVYNRTVFAKLANLFETTEDYPDLIISRNYFQTVYGSDYLFYQDLDHSDIKNVDNDEVYMEYQKNQELIFKRLLDD